MKQCPNCGNMISDTDQFCNKCGSSAANAQQTPPPYGYQQPQQQQYYNNNDAFSPSGPQGKSRGVAGLLAILLGGFGVHYFYLGKTGGGLIALALTLCSCGIWSVLALVQGILMLCMTNAEFQRKYVESTSTMPLF